MSGGQPGGERGQGGGERGQAGGGRLGDGAARVLALIPDLMFGSRVQAQLRAAGHEVQLLSEEDRVRAALEDRQARAAALVVDLTQDAAGAAGTVSSLRRAGLLEGVRTLGFYSHVEASARELAQAAGFDLVVARSRMAREGAELLAGLLAR